VIESLWLLPTSLYVFFIYFARSLYEDSVSNAVEQRLVHNPNAVVAVSKSIWAAKLLPTEFSATLPSSRHHLSYDDCLEDKRENYQNCSVMCCIRQCYEVICTHIWAVLKDECLFRFRFLCVCFAPRGVGAPPFPFFHRCPFTYSSFALIYFSLFPFLIRFTYFLVHSFPLYKNSATPFPGPKS